MSNGHYYRRDNKKFNSFKRLTYSLMVTKKTGEELVKAKKSTGLYIGDIVGMLVCNKVEELNGDWSKLKIK